MTETNLGVSFGLLPGISPWIVGLVLLLLAVVLWREKSRWGRVGIGFVMLGGAFNLFERIFYGGVRDPWVLLGIINNNLADYLIGIGVGVYIVSLGFEAYPKCKTGNN